MLHMTKRPDRGSEFETLNMVKRLFCVVSLVCMFTDIAAIPPDVKKVIEYPNPLEKTIYYKIYRPELQFDTLFLAQLYQYLCDSTEHETAFYKSIRSGEPKELSIEFKKKQDDTYLICITYDGGHTPFRTAMGFCQFSNCRFWIDEGFPPDYLLNVSNEAFAFEYKIYVYMCNEIIKYYFDYNTNDRKLTRLSGID